MSRSINATETFAADQGADGHLQRLRRSGRFSTGRRRDRLSRRAGPAPGRHEAARFAQHREPDGDARRRVSRAGFPLPQMVPPLCSYEPRPHRCEFVRELDGVDYINDSKATNLDAVEKALLAQTKPVVLIAGGKDKGFEYRARSERSLGKSAQRLFSSEKWRNGSRRDWRASCRAKSRSRSPMPWSARMPSRSPATSSSFLRARRPSTCSKATPIAATNFVPSCTRSKNRPP